MATFVHKRYYFAFGSNMHLDQMSTRCTGSMYEGKTVLNGWRWQINKRGVANIVQSASDKVEGLVFSVTGSDEQALDRFEGVRRGHYHKILAWLQFYPVAAKEVQQMARELPLSAHESSGFHSRGIEVHIQALTYVSRITEDGSIREEYVERMSRAARDALALGISERYVRESLDPVIQGPTMESATEPQPRQTRPASSDLQRVSELPGQQVDSKVAPRAFTQSRAEHNRRYDGELAYADACDATRRQRSQARPAGAQSQEQPRATVSADSSYGQDGMVSSKPGRSHQEASTERYVSSLLVDQRDDRRKEEPMKGKQPNPGRTPEDGRAARHRVANEAGPDKSAI